jgi:hypothetical protein
MTHFSTPFFFNTAYQYIAIINLCPLIFGLKPCAWLCYIMLTPTHSIISYGNIIFDLCPLFQEHN